MVKLSLLAKIWVYTQIYRPSTCVPDILLPTRVWTVRHKLVIKLQLPWVLLVKNHCLNTENIFPILLVHPINVRGAGRCRGNGWCLQCTQNLLITTQFTTLPGYKNLPNKWWWGKQNLKLACLSFELVSWQILQGQHLEPISSLTYWHYTYEQCIIPKWIRH